jgi:hypothetical protein
LALSIIFVMGVRRSALTAATTSDDIQSTAAARTTRWWIGGGLLGLVFFSKWLLDYAVAHDRWFPYPLYLYAASVGALIWCAVNDVPASSVLRERLAA